MIFICVRLNRLHFHECRPMPLKSKYVILGFLSLLHFFALRDLFWLNGDHCLVIYLCSIHDYFVKKIQIYYRCKLSIECVLLWFVSPYLSRFITVCMDLIPGNQPTFNVQMYSSSDVLKLFKRLVDIHNAIANYTIDVMTEYTTSGIPAQRPLFLMYSDDSAAYDIKYQYMYGPDLLVAPVIQPNVNTWKVYLPRGDNWVYLWNNTDTNEGQIHVNAPLGLPPVFYRKSSPYADVFSKLKDFKLIVIPTTMSPANGANGGIHYLLNAKLLYLISLLFFTLKYYH